MSNAISFAQELRSMKATDVVRNERVRQQFINVYNSVWREGGEAAYEREAIYFNQQLRDKAPLRECSGVSVFYAFIDLAVRGLTLAPGAQALCYLIPRSCKTGTDASGRDVWEKVCNLTISGYGELFVRKMAGQIRHADNPTVVYEGDTFEYGERDGRKFVNYASAFPRKSNRIVACFIKITRADGSTDYSVMTESDWLRLKNYSDRNNTFTDRRTGKTVVKSNELYGTGDNGDIDPGFLMAKCIKHAFRTYPRIKIGKGSVMESELAEEPAAIPDDPYGIVDTPAQEESFVPRSEGVTVEADEDGAF